MSFIVSLSPLSFLYVLSPSPLPVSVNARISVRAPLRFKQGLSLGYDERSSGSVCVVGRAWSTVFGRAAPPKSLPPCPPIVSQFNATQYVEALRGHVEERNVGKGTDISDGSYGSGGTESTPREEKSTSTSSIMHQIRRQSLGKEVDTSDEKPHEQIAIASDKRMKNEDLSGTAVEMNENVVLTVSDDITDHPISSIPTTPTPVSSTSGAHTRGNTNEHRSTSPSLPPSLSLPPLPPSTTTASPLPHPISTSTTTPSLATGSTTTSFSHHLRRPSAPSPSAIPFMTSSRFNFATPPQSTVSPLSSPTSSSSATISIAPTLPPSSPQPSSSYLRRPLRFCELRDTHASPLQFRVDETDKKFYVTDLRSRDGTLICKSSCPRQGYHPHAMSLPPSATLNSTSTNNQEGNTASGSTRRKRSQSGNAEVSTPLTATATHSSSSSPNYTSSPTSPDTSPFSTPVISDKLAATTIHASMQAAAAGSAAGMHVYTHTSPLQWVSVPLVPDTSVVVAGVQMFILSVRKLPAHPDLSDHLRSMTEPQETDIEGNSDSHLPCRNSTSNISTDELGSNNNDNDNEVRLVLPSLATSRMARTVSKGGDQVTHTMGANKSSLPSSMLSTPSSSSSSCSSSSSSSSSSSTAPISPTPGAGGHLSPSPSPIERPSEMYAVDILLREIEPQTTSSSTRTPARTVDNPKEASSSSSTSPQPAGISLSHEESGNTHKLVDVPLDQGWSIPYSRHDILSHPILSSSPSGPMGTDNQQPMSAPTTSGTSASSTSHPHLSSATSSGVNTANSNLSVSSSAADDTTDHPQPSNPWVGAKLTTVLIPCLEASLPRDIDKSNVSGYQCTDNITQAYAQSSPNTPPSPFLPSPRPSAKSLSDLFPSTFPLLGTTPSSSVVLPASTIPVIFTPVASTSTQPPPPPPSDPTATLTPLPASTVPADAASTSNTTTSNSPQSTDHPQAMPPSTPSSCPLLSPNSLLGIFDTYLGTPYLNILSNAPASFVGPLRASRREVVWVRLSAADSLGTLDALKEGRFTDCTPLTTLKMLEEMEIVQSRAINATQVTTYSGENPSDNTTVSDPATNMTSATASTPTTSHLNTQLHATPLSPPIISPDTLSSNRIITDTTTLRGLGSASSESFPPPSAFPFTRSHSALDPQSIITPPSSNPSIQHPSAPHSHSYLSHPHSQLSQPSQIFHHNHPHGLSLSGRFPLSQGDIICYGSSYLRVDIRSAPSGPRGISTFKPRLDVPPVSCLDMAAAIECNFKGKDVMAMEDRSCAIDAFGGHPEHAFAGIFDGHASDRTVSDFSAASLHLNLIEAVRADARLSQVSISIETH